MNHRYTDYTNYNIWANNCLINDLIEQDDELLGQVLVGSFPTIRATILHIWFAEVGWLSRIKGNGWQASRVNTFSGTNLELFKEWKESSEDFKNFVSISDLEKEIRFDHKGQQFSIPIREIVQTVCNHGSYHRGQVVMMLRQLGVTNITQTDYIEWVRQTIRNNSLSQIKGEFPA